MFRCPIGAFSPSMDLHRSESCWRNSKKEIAGTAAPCNSFSSLFGRHRWRNWSLDCRKLKFCGVSVRILVFPISQKTFGAYRWPSGQVLYIWAGTNSDFLIFLLDFLLPLELIRFLLMSFCGGAAVPISAIFCKIAHKIMQNLPVFLATGRIDGATHLNAPDT